MMIRDSRQSDMGDMYRIALASLDENYSPEIFSYFSMQWPSGQMVMCSPDGTVAGFISSVKLDSSTVRIMMFAVDPRFRGRGIGTRLLSALRMRAMMEGMTAIVLEVRTGNERAIAFYRNNGFVPSGVLEGFYNDGGPAVRMIGRVQLNI